MHPQATIIIPQYNHAHLTTTCLKSLRQHEPTPIEIIVIDDGSDPQPLAELQTHLHSLSRAHSPSPPGRGTASQAKPEKQGEGACLRIIAQPHAGITAAWNLAARHATTPHLIFVNNDTLCHGPIVERLIKPLHSTAILTGPTSRRETALPAEVINILPTQIFIEGWCMAMLRSDFESIGGFDESMTLYFSDTDLQARLLQTHQHERLKLQPVPNLPLRHNPHQTARALPNRRQIWNSDRQTFIQKWTNATSERSEPTPLPPGEGQLQRRSH